MGSKSCLKFEEYSFLEDTTLGVFDNIFEGFITLFHDNEWKIGIIFDYVNYLENHGMILQFQQCDFSFSLGLYKWLIEWGANLILESLSSIRFTINF